MKKSFCFVFLFLLIFFQFHPAEAAPKDAAVIAQGIDATTLDPHMRWTPQRSIS